MNPRALFSALALTLASSLSATEAAALAWDAMQKNYKAGVGEKSASMEFVVKNTSPAPIVIEAIQPSCGCTTFDAPPLPWTLAPGATGALKLKIDLVDKFGEMTKTVHIRSSVGEQSLVMHLSVPLPMAPGDRRKQAEKIMLADRQAIFKRDDCVTCHAHPAAFKTGEPLFQAVCGICHNAEPRASMVPDLAVAKEPRDEAFWRKVISEGRLHTLMPGFGQAWGGPLTDAQIESLVAYSVKTFPRS